MFNEQDLLLTRREKRRGMYRQWKRVVSAAAVTACNGLGGIAGSFIVRADEAPRYISAIWISIGYRYSPFYIPFQFPLSVSFSVSFSVFHLRT